MDRARTRRIERLLLGQHEDVTYWFVDQPGSRLLKKAGRSYYEEMTAPVPPAWVMRFDQPVLEAMGAGWILPIVARLAAGEDCDLACVLGARSEAKVRGEPVLDVVEVPAND